MSNYIKITFLIFIAVICFMGAMFLPAYFISEILEIKGIIGFLIWIFFLSFELSFLAIFIIKVWKKYE